eukprot:TRINITY_DN92_c0_g1_i1.p1 TRINITY_DN92_c0_g1~~TRINITY_DN92_c0_g1_i1.p1  ORF type:complete len:833 (+),score=229.19 TRINITY_DN92_c0_g1_i1:193-2499(+)
MALQHEFNASSNRQRIAVTGLQTMGKSSFVDAFLGVPLSHIHSETATRRPVRITAAQKVSWAYWVDGAKMETLQNLKDRMRAIMEETKTEGSGFSGVPVDVVLHGPTLPDVVVTDLIGLLDSDEPAHAEIAGIAAEYLLDPATIVVAVVKAPVDPQAFTELDPVRQILQNRPGWVEKTIVVANRFNMVMGEEREWGMYFQHMRSRRDLVYFTTIGHPRGRAQPRDEWAKELGEVCEKEDKTMREWQDSLGAPLSPQTHEVLGLRKVIAEVERLFEQGVRRCARKNVEDAEALLKTLAAMKSAREVAVDSMGGRFDELTREFVRHIRAVNDARAIEDQSREPPELSSRPDKSYKPSELPELATDFFNDADFEGCEKPDFLEFLKPKPEVEKALDSHHLGERLKKRTTGKANLGRLLDMMLWYIQNVQVPSNSEDDNYAQATNHENRHNPNQMFVVAARDMIRKLPRHVMPWLNMAMRSLQERYWDYVQNHLLGSGSRFEGLASGLRFVEGLKDAYFRLLRERAGRVAEGFVEEIRTLSEYLSLDMVEREMLAALMSHAHPVLTTAGGIVKPDQDTTKLDDEVLEALGSPQSPPEEPNLAPHERVEKIGALLGSLVKMQRDCHGRIPVADWIEAGVLSVKQGHISSVAKRDYSAQVSQLLYEVGARELCRWLQRHFYAKVMSIFTKEDDNSIDVALAPVRARYMESGGHLQDFDVERCEREVQLLQAAVDAAEDVIATNKALLRRAPGGAGRGGAEACGGSRGESKHAGS